MTRTYRLLDLRGIPARCVTILVTKKTAASMNRTTVLIKDFVPPPVSGLERNNGAARRGCQLARGCLHS